MPQQIKIEPKGEYLHVEVAGAFSESMAMEFIRNIRTTSKQYELMKILVDIRNIKGTIPTMARFSLADFLAAELPKCVYLAVLELRGQVPDDKFFEDVAVNRGAFVKIFFDFKEAIEWLGTKPAKSSRINDI